jgi:hypothetical protein
MEHQDSVREIIARRSVLFTRIGVSLFALAVLIVHKNLPQCAAHRQLRYCFADHCGTPWVLPAVSEAEFPGGWKLKFREVAHEQRRQAEEIEWMKFLLRSFLSQYELDHLRKLGHPEPFLFDFNCATKKFFEKELRRLLDLDLIKRAPNKGVKGLLYEKEGIRKINNKEMKDVKDFSQITETGRDYLRMRDATI